MVDIEPGTQGMPMRCWINPDTFRHFQAGLVLDLFGDWTLVCAWGGLGTRRGNYRVRGVLSYEDGLRKIDELDVYRQKRGYVPVATLADWAAQIAQMKGATFEPPPRPTKQKSRDGEMGLLLE